MGIQQLKRRVWSGVLTFLLAGVVQHAAMADVQAPVDALLEQQLATIERTLEQATSGARSVLYLGAAQNAQSPAFHEDVLRVQQRLQAVNPKLQSIVLSNDTHHKQGPYPAAIQAPAGLAGCAGPGANRAADLVLPLRFLCSQACRRASHRSGGSRSGPQSIGLRRARRQHAFHR